MHPVHSLQLMCSQVFENCIGSPYMDMPWVCFMQMKHFKHTRPPSTNNNEQWQEHVSMHTHLLCWKFSVRTECLSTRYVQNYYWISQTLPLKWLWYLRKKKFNTSKASPFFFPKEFIAVFWVGNGISYHNCIWFEHIWLSGAVSEVSFDYLTVSGGHDSYGALVEIRHEAAWSCSGKNEMLCSFKIIGTGGTEGRFNALEMLWV